MNKDWIGIADLYLQSLQISWDAHPAPQAKLTDLSPAKIDRFIQRVNNNGRFALEGNPALAAEAFYLINAIEKYGTGFIRIRRALQEYPEIDFEVKEFAGGVMVTFAQKQSYFLYGGESEGVSEGVNEGVSEGVNMLFSLIENNPGKRTPFFEEQMRIPAKTIERWITRLKSERKIEFRGAPKTGGYYPVE